MLIYVTVLLVVRCWHIAGFVGKLVVLYLFLFSECSQTLIEFNLFTASHGGTSGVAIYCGWQYIDIFHSKEFLFTGFHGC